MSNATKRQWAFDFGDVQKVRDLKAIGENVKTTDGLLGELSKRTVSWPADGDPKSIEAWEDLDLHTWFEGQNRFLEAYKNFLSAQERGG